MPADDEPTDALTADARHLLSVVHRGDLAGLATDAAAADVRAGGPWYGLEQPAGELQRAGLLVIEPERDTVPDDAAPMPSVFLRLTDAGRRAAVSLAATAPGTTGRGPGPAPAGDPGGNPLAYDDD